MSAGAALGNEMFYILFLPFLFWNVDVRLGRGVVVMWGVLYYIGQLVKVGRDVERGKRREGGG